MPLPASSGETASLGETAIETSEFDYDLPPARIAQRAVEPRDAARLLVDDGPGHPPRHRHVADLVEECRPGDLVVVNDTRVLPARLPLRRASGAGIEALVLGLLGAVGGLAAGILFAGGINALFKAIGADLPNTGTVVLARATRKVVVQGG